MFVGTIQACNMLASNYNGHGLMRFHTHLLTLNQYRNGEIKRTHKNHSDKEMSTISKIAFMTPLKDLQEAALKGLNEKVKDISTNILLGVPVPLGTGHNKTYINLLPYLQNNDKTIEEIIL
jgi:hypothetical protein